MRTLCPHWIFAFLRKCNAVNAPHSRTCVWVAGQMNMISVMVVGTSSIIRDGYQALFGTLPGIAVLDPADDASSAIARLAAEKPDLVILDSTVGMEDANSIISAIKHCRPTQCLAICAAVAQARELRSCGADLAVAEGVPPAILGAEVRRLAESVRGETE